MTFFEYHNAGSTEQAQMQATAFLLAQDTVGKAKNGVLSGLGVTQTPTATSSIIVGAGAGVIQAATLDGASIVGDVQDSVIDVLGPSPVVGNPRNDIVVADRATGSIRVIIGAAAAIPADPAVPSSAIPLARLSHAAGATTVPTTAITDLRVFTTLNQPPSPQWLSITPVYSNTLGENLSVGDGSIVGKWRASGSGPGQSVTFHWKLTRGAGTNLGTGGSWTIGLPVPAADFGIAIGAGMQTIGSARKPLTLEMVSNSLLVMNDVAGNRIGPTNPGGGAAAQAGHVYQGSISYFIP